MLDRTTPPELHYKLPRKHDLSPFSLDDTPPVLLKYSTVESWLKKSVIVLKQTKSK
jgi:hypothetical protein